MGPQGAVTNDHKLGGLTEHTFIIVQPGGQRCDVGLGGPMPRRAGPPAGSESTPRLFQLPEAT